MARRRPRRGRVPRAPRPIGGQHRRHPPDVLTGCHPAARRDRRHGRGTPAPPGAAGAHARSLPAGRSRSRQFDDGDEHRRARARMRRHRLAHGADGGDRARRQLRGARSRGRSAGARAVRRQCRAPRPRGLGVAPGVGEGVHRLLGRLAELRGREDSAAPGGARALGTGLRAHRGRLHRRERVPAGGGRRGTQRVPRGGAQPARPAAGADSRWHGGEGDAGVG